MIDTSFDFRTDATTPDPDASSSTLKRYHRLLWSKPLPCGVSFELDDHTPYAYLHHRSEVGEFYLASDSLIPTFTGHVDTVALMERVPQEQQEGFVRIGYTIGGMLVFPGNKVANKPTINGARGMHPRIKDRFDLTLECIRRHYLGEWNPLQDVLNRYADFFALFRDFIGYADFFLLQDLVADDGRNVRFSLPFEGFEERPVPRNPGEYDEYRRNSIGFVEARNRRIDEWARVHMTR
jgi:hypothetical protein